MKRIIFDLDGTLLTGNYESEFEFFKNIYGTDSNKLLGNMIKFLDEYEKTHPRYEAKLLSKFLSEKTKLDITEEVIDGWADVVGDIPDTMEDGIIEVLEYLKSKDKSLAVLTNWFGKSQISRLKKSGLLEYFDDIYVGDMVLKPHKEAYLCARDRFNLSDCVVIGDNLLKDYIAPRSVGMQSILYDKEEIQHKTVNKVKRMNEIIKRF